MLMIFPCRRSSIAPPAKLAQTEDAIQVDLHDIHPCLCVVTLCGFAINRARIVHQNLRRAHRGDHRFIERIGSVRRAKIRGETLRLPS